MLENFLGSLKDFLGLISIPKNITLEELRIAKKRFKISSDSGGIGNDFIYVERYGLYSRRGNGNYELIRRDPSLLIK